MPNSTAFQSKGHAAKLNDLNIKLKADAVLAGKRAAAIRDWLVAFGCIPAQHTSVTASLAEESAAPKKKAGATGAHTKIERDESVTVFIPIHRGNAPSGTAPFTPTAALFSPR